MTGFAFTLVREDGTPADLPTLTAALPNWRPGDTIPLRYSPFGAGAKKAGGPRQVMGRPQRRLRFG